MGVLNHPMQGTLILPRRFSQQSAGAVHSTKFFTPELVGSLACCPSRTYPSCELVGTIDRQPLRTRRADGAKDFYSVNRSSCGRGGAGEFFSARDEKAARMRTGAWGSFPSCSYSRSVAPLVSHAIVANGGQVLDNNSWKRLSASAAPMHFQLNQAKPWLSNPFQAFPGLNTTHYGSIACKEPRQDVMCDESEKGLISALTSSQVAGDTHTQKISDEQFMARSEDSDSDSDDEEDEKDVRKKHKKEMKMKGAQEDMDSDSDMYSDREKMELRKMKKKSKGKAEVVGTFEDDSDSDSDSDEEKEMKKKLEADEKKLKKQAKKQMKALNKMDSERRVSEGEEKKMKKDREEQEKVRAPSPDADLEQKYQYVEALDSDNGSEGDEQEDDEVEVIAVAPENELEEEDFELVGDDDLSEELESDIENAFEEFDDEELDDDFWEEEEGEAMVGDGGDGGGVALGETQWGKKALELAEVVLKDMGTDFAFYAFKTLPDGQIRVRLDKMSDQYGSPSMNEIENFIKKYRAILDNCEVIPDNISVEVSSPGAERMVKIPDELERFKQLPMYVQYYEDDSGKVEKDGVLELDSFDSSGMTVWKLANVKLNRELSGKGRPLNSKQRKWRAQVPANSLKLVRLYLDV
ncbi:hypothetical protein R1flu_004316 [Riccia fluitans]|uniref:DUF7912 domain-containing protein n=1 Tax=Riccia fluitans TaxID=41844 RepID=A0ABD1YPY1_9MARC